MRAHLQKKKKKSSKKAALDLEAFERELAEDGPAAAGAGGVAGDDEDAPAAPEYGENELGDDVFGGGGGASADVEESGGDGDQDQAWIGTDREYTYDEVRDTELSS